jgi:hypothetical protein
MYKIFLINFFRLTDIIFLLLEKIIFGPEFVFGCCCSIQQVGVSRIPHGNKSSKFLEQQLPEQTFIASIAALASVRSMFDYCYNSFLENSNINFHLSFNLQAIWIPAITKSTLDKLSENCPKLLRVFRPLKGPKRVVGVGPQIYARRLNKDAKLHRVHRIEKNEPPSKQPRLDYDSVESCSDEDCMEH